MDLKLLLKKIYSVSDINLLAPSPPEKRVEHFIALFNSMQFRRALRNLTNQPFCLRLFCKTQNYLFNFLPAYLVNHYNRSFCEVEIIKTGKSRQATNPSCAILQTGITGGFQNVS